MRLLSLEVQNYRNICAARLEPGRELTVICGNNGQGKTNLLRSEEHTELQSRFDLVCRLLLEKKNKLQKIFIHFRIDSGST